MKKLDEGFFDNLKKAIGKRLDRDLSKKVEKILDQPTDEDKKLAKDLAQSISDIEKRYKKLGY
tara:strand:+ start:1049 stop:1237 length:189 start_codon:yes stop_codon:yes gene_type:complete